MSEVIISFLALLNPFALFIYMLPLRKELGFESFQKILIRASIISWAIYVIFALLGDYIFTELLSLNFASFQIFGGMVLIAFALSFILQGKKSMITTKGELSEIAAEVALPFIVGAGTIALSILAGSRLGAAKSVFALTLIMAINALIVIALAMLRQSLKARMKEVLDKNLEIALRLNGFIVGAFGVDLIARGIESFIS